MRPTWFVALSGFIVLGGCLGDPTPGPEAVDQEHEPGLTFFTFSKHFDGSDADLMFNLDTRSHVKLTVRMENMTLTQGNNGWGVTAHALTHDFVNRRGISWIYFGEGRGAVAMSAQRQDVEAGPPVISTLREHVWDYEPDPWKYVMDLAPDHYHLVFGFDGGTADLHIAAESREGETFEIEEAGAVGDIALAYTSSNPHDWEGKTEAWASLVSVVSAHTAWEVRSPLNIGTLGQGPFLNHFEITRGAETLCGTQQDGPDAIGFHPLRNLSPGRYDLQATTAKGYPASADMTFSFVQVPGHPEIEPEDFCI